MLPFAASCAQDNWPTAVEVSAGFIAAALAFAAFMKWNR